MSASPLALPAVALPGLRPDSVGNYLASLGLLRLIAGKWPSVRIAWRDQVLHVVGGPANLAELLDELGCIAAERRWTPYQRDWLEAQKRSTKAKAGRGFAVWQTFAEESTLELTAAHVVPVVRLAFNPLVGKGGSAGNRDLSDGWKRAVEVLAPPSPMNPGKNETDAKKAAREKANQQTINSERARKRDELGRLLLGEPLRWLVDEAPLEPAAKGTKQKKGSLNAACWFSEANKLYNSGQNASREGAVSPWAMALACEGLAFWAGGASRRLGARARAQAAFPFVSRAAAPGVAGEAGRDLGEVWAPLWERPMTFPEIRALFARGRAELGGRGVLTPSAFATAIVRRGVDAGVSELLRFTLGRTTSANTFEPRFGGRFPVRPSVDTPPSPTTAPPEAAPRALECVLGLIDRLPADRKVGKRWRFVGLRGPIEAAMLRLAAVPEDPGAVRAVLDAVVVALDRVDRNRSFRERRVTWEPLPVQYVPSLFGGESPAVEARLALALLSAFPASRPFTLYRFGVEMKYGRFEHTERPPARWVFGPGPLPGNLSRVLCRRTFDWESARKAEEHADQLVRFLMPATSAHVLRWLDAAVDDALLTRWLARLALFDWRSVPAEVRDLAPPDACGPASAALCLFGLIHPLFDRRPLHGRGPGLRRDLLDPRSGARTPGAARALASLVAAGHIDAAVRLAASRYAMAGAPLARMEGRWRVGEPDRLLASVLFPVAAAERTALIERWLRPRRQQGDETHAQ